VRPLPEEALVEALIRPGLQFLPEAGFGRDEIVSLGRRGLDLNRAYQSLRFILKMFSSHVRFYPNPYGLRGIEGDSIPSKSKSPSICINPFQSIWIENNRTSP
jgi:hypothetical protein